MDPSGLARRTAGSSAQRYPLLLSPLDIRGHRLRNRVVSTAHATGWAHDGLLTAAEVDYHVRKAEGGCGLIIAFGSASVDPSSAASYGTVALWDLRNEPALATMARRVHAAGAGCMAQLTHMGRRGRSDRSGTPLRAPSDVPEPVHGEVPVPLETAEVPRIVGRFAETASRLARLGWDGCEVTSFGGHLIEQFFDPACNDRSDAYGGSLANRTRFASEVLSAVRAAVPEDFIVSFRMTADQRLRDGLDPAALREIACEIMRHGTVDLLSVSGGTGATVPAQAATVPPDELPERTYAELAGAMKKATGRPVLVAGRILDPESAEHCLAETGVDLVAMTRALIANPDLVQHAADGVRGRPCISINQGCIGRLYDDLPILCSVNPAIREPALGALRPASAPRRVLVIGAGVAGLEAARGAALRGHQVTVLERRPFTGGRAALAARRPGRHRWLLYLDWLASELASAGARVMCGIGADETTIARYEPDVVVVATGSVPRPVPGATCVIDADTLLENGLPAGIRGRALVLDGDGGFEAPTAAELLASSDGLGGRVELVTELPCAGARIDQTQVSFVRRRLRIAGVPVSANTRLVAADDSTVVVEDTDTGAQQRLEGVGLLVVAGSRRGDRWLRDRIAAAHPGLEVHLIGDALAPRALHDAVAEGARLGASV